MSLRLRVALWYGGLTGLVVLLVALLTYVLHSRSHYDDLDQLLATTAQHAPFDSPSELTVERLRELVAAPRSPELALRVYATDGTLEAASPNAVLAPPVDPGAVVAGGSRPPFDPMLGLAPPLYPVADERGTFGLATDAEGARWRVYVLPESAVMRYLVVLAPLARVDAATARFRQTVPLFAALGALVTSTAGWLLAGRALRPVAAVTETARRIARSRNVHHRVDVPVRSDELGVLAATFNEMLGSVEDAYRAQQRFVADASHELRAPLTAIKANLDLLLRRPNLPAGDRQEALDEAERETQRLANLVADLLVLARADAGVPLRRQRVELDRTLLEALRDARHLARGQSINVARMEPVLVEGDPDRLKQLLLILLDNALKYTPSGGEVTLALRRQEGRAVVTVQDTGVGIAAEDLPHVFERFYRADPARGRDPGGTGLGLPIARSIAKQHGGDVALASQVGQGTTATVWLPAAR